jgi:hypothetical protein
VLAQRTDFPIVTRRRLSPLRKFWQSQFAVDVGRGMTLLMIVLMLAYPFCQDHVLALARRLFSP